MQIYCRTVSEPLTGTEHQFKDLQDGTEYIVRVKAVNDEGSGPYSEQTEPIKCQDKIGMAFLLKPDIIWNFRRRTPLVRIGSWRNGRLEELEGQSDCRVQGSADAGSQMVQGRWTVYLMDEIEEYFTIKNLVGSLIMFSYKTFVPTTHLSGLPIFRRVYRGKIGENNRSE